MDLNYLDFHIRETKYPKRYLLLPNYLKERVQGKENSEKADLQNLAGN